MQESKFFLADAQDKFLTPFINILLGRIIDLFSDVQQIRSEIFDNAFTIQSEIEIAKYEIGLGFMFVGSICGFGSDIVGEFIANPVKSVAQSSFPIIDVNGRNRLDRLEVAGVMKKVNVDKVNDGFRRKLPTGS